MIVYQYFTGDSFEFDVIPYFSSNDHNEIIKRIQKQLIDDYEREIDESDIDYMIV